jgi:hypothetical protein
MDVWRVSGWFGLATERLMIGVVFNTDSLTLGVGLGPIYFGLGAIRG